MIAALKSLRLRSRVHVRSAGWSTLEYLIYPLLMILAAPVLVAALGAEQFGLLMLVSAITGMGGAANLGMGAATVKFVASRLGSGDKKGAIEVVRLTLAIGLVASSACAGALLLAAPWLASVVFGKMGDAKLVSFTLACAAAMLVLTQADGVYSSALKGCERFALTAKLELILRPAMVAASLAAAWFARDVTMVMLVMVLLALFSAVIKGVIASVLFGALVMTPSWGYRAQRQALLGFGLWSWMQNMASMLFSQLDRLLVGALLGASSLGYYTVCMQLAQQIHTIPAAAMSFLFPYFTRKFEQSGSSGSREARDYGVIANLGLSVVLAGLMLAFGDAVLVAWMGETFARESESTLMWLTLAFFLLSVNVAPYYLLMARSHVRYLSLTTLAGSGVGLVVAWILMPLTGLAGAAFARIALGTMTLVFYWKLFRLQEVR